LYSTIQIYQLPKKTIFMKQSILSYALPVLAGFTILAACHKDNNNPMPPPVTKTPLQTYISSDTSLSIYNAAVAKANDESLFAGSDSVTVLVPTNDAFRAQGITAATINNMSSSAVDSLLRYHFIGSSANLKSGTYTSYNSNLGPAVYGYGGTTDSNYFNGSQATRVPVSGSAATVYRLNTPLGVPYATDSSFLNSDTSLSYFNAALKRAGIDPSKNTGWTTILAPTNNAIRAAGYPTIESINNADSVTLRNLLLYHELPGQYFTNSYNGLTTVPTSVSGANINIGTSPGGATFIGTENSTATGFAGPNVIAGNTVYQPINGVLTP